MLFPCLIGITWRGPKCGCNTEELAVAAYQRTLLETPRCHWIWRHQRGYLLHTHTRARTHARTRTHTHAHTRAHTHMYLYPPPPLPCPLAFPSVPLSQLLPLSRRFSLPFSTLSVCLSVSVSLSLSPPPSLPPSLSLYAHTNMCFCIDRACDLPHPDILPTKLPGCGGGEKKQQQKKATPLVIQTRRQFPVYNYAPCNSFSQTFVFAFVCFCVSETR